VLAQFVGDIAGNYQELAAHPCFRQTPLKAHIHLFVRLLVERIGRINDMQTAHVPGWAAIDKDGLLQRAPVIIMVANGHQNVAEQAAFRVVRRIRRGKYSLG